MKKIRVCAFLRDSENMGISPVHYYRAYLPLTTLASKSKRFEVKTILKSELFAFLDTMGKGMFERYIKDYDVYVIPRLFRAQGAEEFVRSLNQWGGRVVFDTDDDLTCDYRDLGRGDDFKETIKQMDLVTVSTPFLADRLEGYIGYRPTILYNHLDVKWFSKTSMDSVRKARGLSVGFIGTPSHEADWTFPVEALIRLSEEKGITVSVAGYIPDYLAALPNAMFFEAVPYTAYPSLMRQFDIVCCSLDTEDVFNLSKSSVKALESMAAARRLPNGKLGGAVPVCTDMTLYRRTVSHRHNGMLTSNDSWYETLLELIEDTSLRHKLAEQGLKWVTKHRNIETGYKSWERVYRRLNG